MPKIDTRPVKMTSPHGHTSLSVDENQYDADKDGFFEVIESHVAAAEAHGLVRHVEKAKK